MYMFLGHEKGNFFHGYCAINFLVFLSFFYHLMAHYTTLLKGYGWTNFIENILDCNWDIFHPH